MISDQGVAAVVSLSGAAFILFAQLARRRAIASRGQSLRTSSGLAQVVPYFFPVPYVVVVFGLGPQAVVADGLRALGVALSVVGVAVSIWSIVTLGRHYDLVLEIHRGHELVRRGPFGYVRHPVYTGLGLHFLGASLATGNLLLLGGTLFVTIPAFVARARAEERLLRERFGAEYERYSLAVPMLLPRLGGRSGRSR